MDSKCLEIERVMEGVRNLVENRCPFSLGLVFGWENPYDFIIIFFPTEVFFFLFLSLKNILSHTYTHPTLQAGSRIQARKWGRLERGLGWTPPRVGSGNC